MFLYFVQKIQLSVDLHVNKYNHIWLPNELGFMLILLLKNNEEEVFYQLLRYR